ncbi:hypothetical protein FB451DRAFT_1550715 [Mycena latifolia]|nr:hypothetical protein FB451DRAFT_1550715 [Mycena latifolia]
MSSPASDSSSSSSSTTSMAVSSCTMGRRLHAASLVDPASHSPLLIELIDMKLSRPVIGYIVDCVAETVDVAMGPCNSTTQPAYKRTRPRSRFHTKFVFFVSTLIARAEVAPPAVLTALVYVARVRPHLSIQEEEWARERVWLGALIAATKYTHDSTLKNTHWALYTGVFDTRDVGRIEREFLDVLDWELGVTEADLLAHHAGLTTALEASGLMSSTASMFQRTRHVHPVLFSDYTADSDDPTAPSAPHPDPHLQAPHKTRGSGALHALLRAFPSPRSTHRQVRITITA